MAKLFKGIFNSMKKKIIIIFVLLMMVTTFSIGFAAYRIARVALRENGEKIIESHVNMALSIIEKEQKNLKYGIITEEEAKENVKTILLGNKKSDGTRDLHNYLKYGSYGYMIVYDIDGNEIMHPTLEGQNVWDVTDMADDKHFIVQDQIKSALTGGGFDYYTWTLPQSDITGAKISYSYYEPNWGWVVVATAYEKDFDADANKILILLNGVMIIIIIAITFILSKIVNIMSDPIIEVSKGMDLLSNGLYQQVSNYTFHDEIGQLARGYNKMVDSIEKTQLRLTEKTNQLSYIAYNDELTQLSNRNGFKAFVSERLSKEPNSAYLIQMDIQGFKGINAIIGYEQGDVFLKLVSQYFINQQSEDLLIARTSGNEFSIWLENITLSDMLEKINHVKTDINLYLNKRGFYQMIDFHVAYVMCLSKGPDFETLYNKTSMALKHAKEKGDFKIYAFEEAMEKAILDELEMRKHLKNAIVNGEIRAFYQEKYDYQLQEVVGVEALARWQSDELGFVPPNIFIPALEHLNLASDFGNYMMAYVFEDYSTLKSIYGEAVTVSINISPTHFLEPGFISNALKALHNHKIPPQSIIFEVTEEIFIADFERISQIISALHLIGFKIAIDDFGTGYSSFNYLKKIDFDELKIDKTFMDEIIENEKAFKLFELLCEFADVLGYSMVAEGIETQNQLEKIKSTPLTVIQGYLFSKPMAIDDLKNKKEENKNK